MLVAIGRIVAAVAEDFVAAAVDSTGELDGIEVAEEQVRISKLQEFGRMRLAKAFEEFGKPF